MKPNKQERLAKRVERLAIKNDNAIRANFWATTGTKTHHAELRRQLRAKVKSGVIDTNQTKEAGAENVLASEGKANEANDIQAGQ